MRNKKKNGTSKKRKKLWKKPDFEIHSLLNEDLYIKGSFDCSACDCDCPCDPGS